MTVEALTITGGSGNDSITTGDSNDIVFGDDGDDTINVGAGADIVRGGLGKDVINLGSGLDRVVGSLADLDGDRIQGFDVNETILVEGSAVQSVWTTPDGDDTLLNIDENGDGTAEAVLRLTRFTAEASFAMSISYANTTLTASDNLLPTASPIDAGSVAETAGVVDDRPSGRRRRCGQRRRHARGVERES